MKLSCHETISNRRLEGADGSMTTDHRTNTWFTLARLKVGILGVFTMLSAVLASFGIEQALMSQAGAADPMWSLQTALLVTVVFTVLTGLFGMAAYEQVRRRIRTRARLIPAAAGNLARVMIMTLSLLEGEKGKQEKLLKQALQELDALDENDEAGHKALLDRICLSDEGNLSQAPFTGWKWQQSFRLIRFKGETLKQINLVLSEEVHGKTEHIEAFKNLARPFLDPHCRNQLAQTVHRHEQL